MELSLNARVVVVAVLLGMLSSLLIFGGIDRPPAPGLGDYAGTDEIAQQPETYLGEPVSVGGQVLSTDPVILRAEYGTSSGVKTVQLEIIGVDNDVEEGDTLQVFGVLTDPQTVRSTKTVVVPATGRWYAWITSLIAGLWVLARVIGHWDIDRRDGGFGPRPRPRSVTQLLSWTRRKQ